MKCGKMRIILMLAVGIYVTGQAMSTGTAFSDEEFNSAIAARNFTVAQQMINDLKQKNSKLRNKEQQAIQNRKVKGLQATLERAKKAPSKIRQPVSTKPAVIQSQQPQTKFPVREPEMETPYEAPIEQAPIIEPAHNESFALLDAIEGNIAQAHEFYNQKSHSKFMQALNRAHQGIVDLDQQLKSVRATAEFMHRRERIVQEINALIEKEERRMQDARQPRASEVPTQKLMKEIEKIESSTIALNQEAAMKGITADNYAAMKAWANSMLTRSRELYDQVNSLLRQHPKNEELLSITSRIASVQDNLQTIMVKIETFAHPSKTGVVKPAPDKGIITRGEVEPVWKKSLTALMHTIKEELEAAQANVSTAEGVRDYEDLIAQVNDLDQKIVQAERECADIAQAHPATKAMIADYVNILADYTSRLDRIKDELYKVKEMVSEGSAIVPENSEEGILGEIFGEAQADLSSEIQNLNNLIQEFKNELREAYNKAAEITKDNYLGVQALIATMRENYAVIKRKLDALQVQYSKNPELRNIALRMPGYDKDINALGNKLKQFDFNPTGGVVSVPSSVFQGEEVMRQPSDVSAQPPSEEERLAELEKSLNIAHTSVRDLRNQFDQLKVVNTESYNDFVGANQLLRNFLTKQYENINKVDDNAKKKCC